MDTQHSLTEHESDFMEDGYYAVCSCGWKSLNAPTMTAAQKLHADHIEQRNKHEGGSEHE